MKNVTITVVDGKVDWKNLSLAIDEFSGEINRLYEQSKATAELIKKMRDALESNLTLLRKHAENTTFSTIAINEADQWLKENGDYCKCDKQKEGCGADRWAVNGRCNTCGKEVGDEQ